MRHKFLILISFIFFSGVAFGQRDDGNSFSVKIKFDKKIPVEEIRVYYTEAKQTAVNTFENVNYRAIKETNEIELIGENIWIAGNNSHFPIIVFSHSENKEYGFKKQKTERLRFYYLINEDYSFEEGFNKEILFRPFHHRAPYILRIDKDRKVNYDTETKLFLSSLIEINPL